MCSRQCQDREEESISCGGDETESVYETGSDLPGSVKSVKVQETTQDKITIEFDPPERNGTELSGYEIGAFVNIFSPSISTKRKDYIQAFHLLPTLLKIENLLFILILF